MSVATSGIGPFATGLGHLALLHLVAEGFDLGLKLLDRQPLALGRGRAAEAAGLGGSRPESDGGDGKDGDLTHGDLLT
jgi:hypothetical protein